MPILLSTLLLGSAAIAQATQLRGAEEARYHALIQELRCLVCQNQNIADSNAPLAQDLREQVRRQIAEGRSDEEIKAYMTARYGDFVLYRPPVAPHTIALWVAPFVLLVLGLAIALARLRRRRVAARSQVDAAALRRLMDEDEGPTR